MLFINLAGIALILLIVWWFWLYKPSQQQYHDSAEVIRVDNGVYTPALIRAPAQQALTLTFLRIDGSPCAETVIFPDLDRSESLPIGQNKQITLAKLKPGEYPFHCPMKMYHGLLKVE